MNSLVHITSYKFVALAELGVLKAQLFNQGQKLQLLGTILLSEEGINVNLAGDEASIEAFKVFMATYPSFADMTYKATKVKTRPFKHLRVKIKPEIITIRKDEIKPEQKTVDHVSPATFKQWLDAGEEVIVIDTRNDYEIEYGTFSNAIDLKIEQFTDFPRAIEQLGEQHKDKRVVIFCTGGVRCEKAGPVMAQQGYRYVYQLQGGIINYFTECGAAHYQGNCFVFDERIAINEHLEQVR